MGGRTRLTRPSVVVCCRAGGSTQGVTRQAVATGLRRGRTGHVFEARPQKMRISRSSPSSHSPGRASFPPVCWAVGSLPPPLIRLVPLFLRPASLPSLSLPPGGCLLSSLSCLRAWIIGGYEAAVALPGGLSRATASPAVVSSPILRRISLPTRIGLDTGPPSAIMVSCWTAVSVRVLSQFGSAHRLTWLS